jgi:hypothetical protein
MENNRVSIAQLVEDKSSIAHLIHPNDNVYNEVFTGEALAALLTNKILTPDGLTLTDIEDYFSKFNVIPTKNNKDKMLKLYKALYEMEKDNIVTLTSSNTSDVSVYGIKTIDVNNMKKWTEKLSCLGEEMNSSKRAKSLPRVYEVLNFSGIMAVVGTMATEPRCHREKKHLQSHKYTYRPDKMPKNALRAFSRLRVVLVE